MSRMCMSTNAALISMGALVVEGSEKLALNSEREKCGKTANSPFITTTTSFSSQLRTGMSANFGDEMKVRTNTVRETTCRCMITATSISAGIAPAASNAPVISTTGIFHLVRELDPNEPVIATTGMTPPVRELLLQNFHSFLLSQTPSTCRSTTTGVINLAQELHNICTVWTIPWTCTITGKSTTLSGRVHSCTVSAAARALHNRDSNHHVNALHNDRHVDNLVQN